MGNRFMHPTKTGDGDVVAAAHGNQEAVSDTAAAAAAGDACNPAIHTSRVLVATNRKQNGISPGLIKP
jgi:hypothetical protein